MDMRLIQYFMSVYEERSFAKAAERMHVVPSALSMQIRNLEEELGATVFDRTNRGVEATVAGRRFYELCQPVARTLAFAKQEMRDLVQGNSVSGSLRVGIPSATCQGILGTVLDEFTGLYPNVDVTIVEAYSRYVTDQVHSGFLDVALGALPVEHSGLACRTGFQDHFVLMSGQPIQGPQFTPCDLADIPDLKLVVPSDRHLMGATLLEYITGGEIFPKRVMKIDGLVATMEAIRHSNWAAVCQSIGLIQELGRKDIYIYPIVKPKLSFELYFLHHPRRPLTLAARCFVDILERQLAKARASWNEVYRWDGYSIEPTIPDLKSITKTFVV